MIRCTFSIVIISFGILKFSFSHLMAQDIYNKSILHTDTIYLDYRSDSVFYSELLSTKCPVDYLVGTDYVSINNNCRHDNTFFMRKNSFIPRHFNLNNVPKRVLKYSDKPSIVVDIPNSGNMLFLYAGYYVLGDSNNRYVRSWKDYEFSLYLYKTDVDFVNTYRLGDELYVCTRRPLSSLGRKYSKVYNNIPINTSVAYISISKMLRLKRVRLKDYKYITSSYSSDSLFNTFFQVMCSDRESELLWFSSVDFNSLVQYSPKSGSVIQFHFPDPIPPGLPYMQKSMITRNGYSNIILKRNTTDSIHSFIIEPNRILKVDNSDKLMYMYIVKFNHDSHDSLALRDLEDNVIISGKPWLEYNPSITAFVVFQMITPGVEAKVEWHVMVPIEHAMRFFSATENSITGLSQVYRDNHYVPALVTWHLK
jgi:hypothetical protein